MSRSIAPSILSFSHADLRLPVQDMAAAGATWLHVDVMDGQFVPPITFGDGLVKSLRTFCPIAIEAHLMTLNPERQIQAFAQAGCSRLIFHAEVAPHSNRVVQAIHEAGMEAGVAINPGTPLAMVEELAGLVESVLVMTVNPGYGGQKFLPEALGKVRRLREAFPHITIEVDGGIAPGTIEEAEAAGANLFVVGSFLQSTGTIAEAFQALGSASC